MGWEQFRYDGKRVLVSGGATGMGAAIATLVGELGGEVVVADVKPVGLPGVQSVHMDLRDRSSIDAALADIAGSDPLDLFVRGCLRCSLLAR